MGEVPHLHPRAYSSRLRGNSDGATPLGGLIRDSEGNLYGTAYTNFELHNINGTVFKVTP